MRLQSRKGSLELSVNAIVILVLAITMLGLGIAFTKGKFSELGSRIEIPEPDFPATPDDPIVLATNEITVKSTKDTIFSIKVYNDGGLPASYKPLITCTCDKGAAFGTDVTSHQNITAVAQNIPVGDDASFKVNVDNMGTTYSGATCICRISAGTSTKQFTMKIS